MLVIPAAGDAGPRRAAARGDAGRVVPPAAAGRCRVVTWERPTIRTRSSPAMVRDARAATPADRSGSPSPTTCRRCHLLRLQERLAGAAVRARVAGPARAADGQGRRRDRAAAARPPTPPTGSSPRSPPAGWSAGPRRTSRARSASGSSPRATTRPSSRSSAPGPNSASPHHEASERVIRAGEPIVLDIGGTIGGYGSRHHADAVGDRRRPGQRPGRASSATCSASCTAAQAAATRAVRPGVAAEAIDRPPRDVRSRPRATARRSSTGPATGSASRATRTRTSSPATTSRSATGMAFSDRARDLPRRASTAPGSRTSSSAARTARSRSTRRRASCTSSTAERRGGSRPRARAAAGRLRPSAVSSRRRWVAPDPPPRLETDDPHLPAALLRRSRRSDRPNGPAPIADEPAPSRRPSARARPVTRHGQRPSAGHAPSGSGRAPAPIAVRGRVAPTGAADRAPTPAVDGPRTAARREHARADREPPAARGAAPRPRRGRRAGPPRAERPGRSAHRAGRRAAGRRPARRTAAPGRHGHAAAARPRPGAARGLHRARSSAGSSRAVRTCRCTSSAAGSGSTAARTT